MDERKLRSSRTQSAYGGDKRDALGSLSDAPLPPALAPPPTARSASPRPRLTAVRMLVTASDEFLRRCGFLNQASSSRTSSAALSSRRPLNDGCLPKRQVLPAYTEWLWIGELEAGDVTRLFPSVNRQSRMMNKLPPPAALHPVNRGLTNGEFSSADNPGYRHVHRPRELGVGIVQPGQLRFLG
jgi:hypothetical protein